MKTQEGRCVEKQYEIAKDFTPFDWITSAYNRGYSTCDDFRQDLKWFFDEWEDDHFRTVELAPPVQAYLNTHAPMRRHWLDEGFIREAAENPFKSVYTHQNVDGFWEIIVKDEKEYIIYSVS